MTEVLIDLDRAGPPPDLDAPRSRSARTRSWWLAPGRLAAAGLVVAVAAVLGGAAAPPPPRFGPPVRVAVGPANAFVLLDDLLVVHAEPDLRGYGLDGTLRWSVPAAGHWRLSTVSVPGLVLTHTAAWPGRTRALDRRTGALRWQSDGGAVARYGDTVLLAYERDGLPPPPQNVASLARVRAADGTELARMPLEPGDGRWAVQIIEPSDRGGWQVGGYALVDAAGNAEVLDGTTGARRTLTGWPPPSRVEALLAVRPGPGGALVAWGALDEGARGYLPGADRPAWSTGPGEYVAGPCDPWLCLSTQSASRVVDPRSGVEVLRTEWSFVHGRVGDRLLAASGRGALGRLGVLDLATGRTLRGFEDWEPVSAPVAPWVPLVRQTPRSGWEVAALRLTDGRAYRLGRFSRPGRDPCQATFAHVACATENSEILVWRYRTN